VKVPYIDTKTLYTRSGIFDGAVLATTIWRQPFGAELFWRWGVLAPVQRLINVCNGNGTKRVVPRKTLIKLKNMVKTLVYIVIAS